MSAILLRGDFAHYYLVSFFLLAVINFKVKIDRVIVKKINHKYIFIVKKLGDVWHIQNKRK